jgi:hypothetical protein
VEAVIRDDIQRGRVIGPFSEPPTSGFVANPMGAFCKRSSDKIRVIHDLSWPPGHSINDYISNEYSALHYIKFDEIVTAVKTHGKGAIMSKIDLCSAFKHILVKQDQWELLGFKFDNKDNCGNLKTNFYMSSVMVFGLRSAPKLYDKYAQGLEYIMLKHGVSYVCHYLDDSFTVASDMKTCSNNLHIMLNTCHELGFEIQPTKIVKPSTCVEMLGIIIDSDLMQLRVSEDRLHTIKKEILSWFCKKTCTKRQLLSLIGKLEFICKVVRHGRTFLRRLIEVSKKVKQLHHKLRLNRMIQNDLKWWIYFMPYFHGVSMFYEEEWIASEKLNLWTDASDFGVGCIFGNQYICEKFDKYCISMPIAWRELYAIVLASATWGYKLSGKRVIFNCDNEAIVHCIINGFSKNVDIMTLLRRLFFICACCNFECSAKHLPSKRNVLADALSRNDMNRFSNNCNILNMSKCKPVDILCDLNNYR